MVNDKSVIWNAVNPFNEYEQLEGCLVHLQHLVQNVQHNFDGDLIILSSPGYASLLAFKKETLEYSQLCKDDNSNKMKFRLKMMPRQIVKECKEINLDNSTYRCRETPKLTKSIMLKKNGSSAD